MSDMSEYYQQISEIQRAVREREMHRLELEKERLLKAQRREKRHEELRNKIKALHKELVSEELEASQRVRKLLAQVEAVTREHKLLESHTEKLRHKKRQYEALLEKNYSTKSSCPNYLNLLQTANMGSFSLNIPGIIPQATNTSSGIPQGASTPNLLQSMSTLHPFPTAVPQISPIAPSSQWPVQQPENNLEYGHFSGNNTMLSASSQPGAPHNIIHVNQQHKLAKRSYAFSNEVNVSSAPLFVPGANSYIQNPYCQQHLKPPTVAANQLDKDNSMINYQSAAHSQQVNSQIVHHIPDTQQIPTMSFSHSNLYNQLNPSQNISHSMPVYGPHHAEEQSGGISTQNLYKNPTDYTDQIQEQVLSQPQYQEKSPLTNYQHLLNDIKGSHPTSVPDQLANNGVNIRIASSQLSTDPSYSAVRGISLPINDFTVSHQQSEEASTSTGLPSRPTVTGLSEVQSIDSAQGNNEIMEESLPPSSQDHPCDTFKERHIHKQSLEETINDMKHDKNSSQNLGKINTTAESDTHDLLPNEKNIATSSIHKDMVVSHTEEKAKSMESKLFKKDVSETSDSGKIPTTKETSNNAQSQRDIQTEDSTCSVSALPAQNNKNLSLMVSSVTEVNEAKENNSKPSAVQHKKNTVSTPLTAQLKKSQAQLPSESSVSEVRKSSALTNNKESSTPEKKQESASNINASGTTASQPSVSSLTDSSSTIVTSSFPSKTSLSKVQPQDDDNDSDFFDRDVPITATTAYKAMVSSSQVKAAGGSTESDSDDLECQMNAMIAQKDPPKSRPVFKPFASSIPSLRPAPPGTDTDSVDSVEAAIQAAMSKSKGNEATLPEATTASNESENTTTPNETIKPAPKAILSKPRASAALQINLDSESESGEVSAGAGGSDDDDFDFYD